MIVLYLSFLILLMVAYFINEYFKNAFNYWTNLNVPHPKPKFPLGNVSLKIVSEFGNEMRNIYQEMKQKGAKYCGLNLVTLPVFMPISTEITKEILIKSAMNFEHRGLTCDEKIDPMCMSLATLAGEDWRFIRSKFSTAFTSTKLKQLLPLIKEVCCDLEKVIENVDAIDIQDLCIKFTTDVFSSCAFGVKDNALQNPNAEFYKIGTKLTFMDIKDILRTTLATIAPAVLKIFKIPIFNPSLTGYFHKIISENIHYRELNNIKRNDIINLLIELKNNKSSNESPLTINQIAANLFFLFFAGFDTTAMNIAFCMYELAVNPNIQNKVRQEFIKVIEENNGDLTYEALNNLVYTEKVISESLRKYPPLITLIRMCTQDFQIPETKIIIKKDTRVIISILGLHYDEEYYPNPEKFDPERFSEEEKTKRPSFAFLPFGDGQRICIGKKFANIEVKLALWAFLKDYEYSLHPDMNPNVELISRSLLISSKEKVLLKATKILSNN